MAMTFNLGSPFDGHHLNTPTTLESLIEGFPVKTHRHIDTLIHVNAKNASLQLIGRASYKYVDMDTLSRVPQNSAKGDF